MEMAKRLVHLDRDRAEEAAIRRNPKPPPPRSINPLYTRLLLMAFCTMAGVEFSTVLPSLWIYVQELAAVGTSADEDISPVTVQLFAHVAFVVSVTCSKLICGALADRGRLTPLFAVCTMSGALGGLLYGFARVFGHLGGSGIKALLSARLIMGGAGGLSTLVNTYTVRAEKDVNERQAKLATNAACTLVGVLIGPGVVPIFAHVRLRILGSVLVDQCNLPGLFLFGVFSLLTVLQPCLLTEPHGSASVAPGDAAAPAASIADSLTPHGAPAQKKSLLYEAPETASSTCNPVLLSLVLDLSLSAVFACVMFSTTPVVAIVTEDEFMWGPVRNSFVFLGMALFTLTGVLGAGALLKRGTTPPPILLVSACLLLTHELIISIFEEAVLGSPLAFLLWLGTISVAYSCLNGALSAQITRTVPSAQVGLYLGATGVIESVGNACGPLVLRLFGAEAAGARMAHVLAISRLALAVPTALVLGGHVLRALGHCTGGLPTLSML